jgi:hypothetical protein
MGVERLAPSRVENASGLVWGFEVALDWQPAWCAVVMGYE